ncbi:hypothetical protein D9M68_573880 [compost metagenome]
MDVQMWNGLACGSTIIYADVVAIRMEFTLDIGSGLIQEFKKRGTLLWSDLEERADMPSWDDQDMPRRDWESISDPESVGILA